MSGFVNGEPGKSVSLDTPFKESVIQVCYFYYDFYMMSLGVESQNRECFVLCIENSDGVTKIGFYFVYHIGLY